MDNKVLDEAVNLALDAYFSGDCERPHYPEHIAAMRAALLAGVKVLLGEELFNEVMSRE